MSLSRVAGADVLMYVCGVAHIVRQRYIVYPSTVAAIADTVVFFIGEAEGMATGADRVGCAGPLHFARGIEHVVAVNVEVELVVVGLRRHLVEEAYAVGMVDSAADAHFRGHAATHGVGRTGAVGTFIGVGVVYQPLNGTLCPAAEVELVAFEGLAEAVADYCIQGVNGYYCIAVGRSGVVDTYV